MPERGESFVVPAALDEERVDRAVALLTGWTRGEVQALLGRGAIEVDGRTVGKSHRLAAGAVVAVLVVAVALFGRDRPPAEKAALFGASAGVLFAFEAAAMKTFGTAVSDGLTAVLTSWSSYALLFSAAGGFYLMQVSLQAGALAPAIASSNAANPVASAVLARTMYLETPHRTAGGKVASFLALAVLVLGLIWIARGQSPPGQALPEPC